MKVDAMLDALVGREGNYVNHPSDRGGPTRWGVTEQVARAFGYKGEMRVLPRDMALSIYRERYWTAPKFDLVAQRYPRLAEEMLDTGVNMGQTVPAKFLQRALNLFNRRGDYYPDIAPDGILGRMSFAALDSFRQRRGETGGEVLRKALDCLQGARYFEIAERDQKQEDFTFGWFDKRIGELA